jgi:hypothetical protein
MAGTPDYFLYAPIESRMAKTNWMRCGAGWIKPNGSISIQVDTLPTHAWRGHLILHPNDRKDEAYDPSSTTDVQRMGPSEAINATTPLVQGTDELGVDSHLHPPYPNGVVAPPDLRPEPRRKR